MEQKKYGTIVLAGALATPDMDPGGVFGSRAMVEINGIPIAQYVVDALRASNSVGQIVIVGEVQIQGVDKVLEPEGNMVDNIIRAIPHIDDVECILITCADIPMLTPEAIDDFTHKARQHHVDLVYPVVEKSSCTGLYAGLKRTYVKTADGCFTGGNMAFVNRDFFLNFADAISRCYALRKKPFALAGMIGYGVLLKFIVAQIFPAVLPLVTIEKAAGRLLGATLKAQITEYPEIGQDIDKYADIAVAEKILSSRKAIQGSVV